MEQEQKLLNLWTPIARDTPLVGSLPNHELLALHDNPALQWLAQHDSSSLQAMKTRAEALGKVLWELKYDTPDEDTDTDGEAALAESDEQPATSGGGFGIGSFFASVTSTVVGMFVRGAKDSLSQRLFRFWALLCQTCRAQDYGRERLLALCQSKVATPADGKIYGKEWRESWPAFIAGLLEELGLNSFEMKIYLMLFDSREGMRMIWNMLTENITISFKHATLADMYYELFFLLPVDETQLMNIFLFRSFYSHRVFLDHRFDPDFWNFNNRPILCLRPKSAATLEYILRATPKKETPFVDPSVDDDPDVIEQHAEQERQKALSNEAGIEKKLSLVETKVVKHENLTLELMSSIAENRRWGGEEAKVNLYTSFHGNTQQGIYGWFFSNKPIKFGPILAADDYFSTHDLVRKLFDSLETLYPWRRNPGGSVLAEYSQAFYAVPRYFTCLLAARADYGRDLYFPEEFKQDNGVTLHSELISYVLKFAADCDFHALLQLRFVSKAFNLAIKSLCPTYQIIFISGGAAQATLEIKRVHSADQRWDRYKGRQLKEASAKFPVFCGHSWAEDLIVVSNLASFRKNARDYPVEDLQPRCFPVPPCDQPVNQEPPKNPRILLDDELDDYFGGWRQPAADRFVFAGLAIHDLK